MSPQTDPSHASQAYGQSGSPKINHTFSNVPSADISTIKAFISEKNGGADPVTALAIRSETSEKSVTARDARVRQEMADSLAMLVANGGA